MCGDVTAERDLTVEGDVYVQGDVSFCNDDEGTASNVNICGNLLVDCVGEEGGDLVVCDDVTVGGNLTVAGSATFDSPITLTGTATILPYQYAFTFSDENVPISNDTADCGME